MRLFDKYGVAERLALSPKTVMAYRHDGLPFFADKGVKIGRSVRWKESDLDDYINGLDYDTAA